MSSNQELSHHAGSEGGQVQMKKEEYLSNVSHAMNQSADQHSHSHSHSQPNSQSQSDQSLISQASNVLSQTGGQVKNMAQGAADAVKNTLGMSPASNNSNSPSNRSNTHGSKNL